jgi:hypothetical protein
MEDRAMKKQYMKPSMKVFKLNGQAQLLTGSYPGEVYIPGIGVDKNHLA